MKKKEMGKKTQPVKTSLPDLLNALSKDEREKLLKFERGVAEETDKETFLLREHPKVHFPSVIHSALPFFSVGCRSPSPVISFFSSFALRTFFSSFTSHLHFFVSFLPSLFPPSSAMPFGFFVLMTMTLARRWKGTSFTA